MLARTLKRTLPAVLVVAGGLAGAASPAMAASWDFASPYPIFSYHGKNHELFAEQIREATDGEIAITVHGGASLIKLPEIRRAVQTQQVAIGEQLMSTLENVDPIFGLDAVPFLADTIEEARLLWYASRQAIEEKLDEQGLKLLYAVAWPGQGMFSVSEINTVEDLQGMKMRIQSPGTAQLADALGSVPVRVEAADIAQAMSTGIAEAFITSSSTGYNISAWDFSDYFYDLNVFQPKNVVYMNKDIFEGLSEEQQAAVMEAAAKAEARGWYMMTREVATLQERLCQQLTCVSPAGEELAAGFSEIGNELTQDWLADAGEQANAIVEDYQAMVEAGEIED